ncbi:hypothetical protein B4903_18310 [Yersinia frederiksenii]|nr:hypothetical protein B4903_18310 [Yersinia frederiksenii]
MIRPVLSFSVVKGMYNFTGLVIRVFQFLLIVPDTKLLQSVVWTGMALDRGGWLHTIALQGHRFY